MRSFLAAVAALFLVVSAPAEACLAEPVTEAALFDARPSPPRDYAVLKVVGRLADPNGERLFVRIVDPAQARKIGPTAWLVMGDASSCTTWGRLGSPAYVVARVAGRWRGRTLLEALVYQRSGWDRFWSVFGWETYRAPRRPL